MISDWLQQDFKKKKIIQKLVDQSHLYLTNNPKVLLYLYSMKVEIEVLVLLGFFFFKVESKLR